MKASLLQQYGRLVWQDVPDPVLSDDDILIRVSHASICGTDVHIFKGEFDGRTRLPLIPGHEFAGSVADAGAFSHRWKKGQPVVVDPILWCGQCAACQAEHYPACSSLKLLGIDLDGGFAEYAAVPESTVYAVPEGVSPEHAAMVEILSIGFHAAGRAGVSAGDSVLIWGCGKVGQSILQAVRQRTTAPVIMVDVLPDRLSNAVKTWPDVHAVNAAETDVLAAVNKITGGRGVDVAFEAVGHARVLPQNPQPVPGCIKAIRGGGTVCVLGLSDDEVPLVMKEMIWKEARLVTSRVSHGEYEAVLAALSKGQLKPDALISDILPGSEAQTAFDLLRKEPERHLKVLLTF